MKVVFLDIDGVLNCHRYLSSLGPDVEWFETEGKSFDPKAIERVNRLVDAGAVFVLSSSWRGTPGLVEALHEAGFKGEFLGETPRIGRPRGLEINAWLREHPEVKKFTILDDDSDMAHLKPYLVKTNFFRGGLLDHHVEEALEMLGL